MKTTIDIPDKLFLDIKLRAVRSGRKLKDLIAELLRKGLAESSQPVAPAARPVLKTDPETGFPFVECPPDAPARRMTAAELIALEQQTQTEEDLEGLGVSH